MPISRDRSPWPEQSRYIRARHTGPCPDYMSIILTVCYPSLHHRQSISNTSKENRKGERDAYVRGRRRRTAARGQLRHRTRCQAVNVNVIGPTRVTLRRAEVTLQIDLDRIPDLPSLRKPTKHGDSKAQDEEPVSMLDG